jgi:tetratricopeptide (TPR) repeat protein
MAYANKGFALCQLKKYKEGISYYDKAIEIDPIEEIFILNKNSALYGLENLITNILAYKISLS